MVIQTPSPRKKGKKEILILVLFFILMEIIKIKTKTLSLSLSFFLNIVLYDGIKSKKHTSSRLKNYKWKFMGYNNSENRIYNKKKKRYKHHNKLTSNHTKFSKIDS